jgi:hypothetical protein
MPPQTLDRAAAALVELGLPSNRRSAAFRCRASAAGASRGGKHRRRPSLPLKLAFSRAQSLAVANMPHLATVHILRPLAPRVEPLNAFPVSHSLFPAFCPSETEPKTRYRVTPASSAATRRHTTRRRRPAPRHRAA